MLGETVIKPFERLSGKSEELNRAGKFLFGSYWFTDEFTRLKQLRTLFRLAQEQLGKIDDRLVTLAVGDSESNLTEFLNPTPEADKGEGRGC